MAPRRTPGRKALIGGVALAMVGTLGLMVAAMRSSAGSSLNWSQFAGNWNQQEATRTDSRQVALTAGVRRIEIVTSGAVRVTPGPLGKLSIAATVRAYGPTQADAAKALKDTAWQLHPADGDTVRLEGNPPSGDSHVRINGRTFGASPQTDFVVQAPPGLQVIVRGDSGDVSVAGMAGADLKTDSGRIEAAGIRGDLIAEADSGSLSARDLTGDVQATTDSGSLTVINAAGAVKATADSGGIRVERAGRATLRTEHGRIEVRHVARALAAESTTGRISAEDYGGGAVLTSDHGSITARRVRGGKLAARTETGTIDLEQPGITDVDYDLHSEHGSVELALPRTATLTVELKSDHGRIETDLALPAARADDVGGHSLTGKLGDGKHRLAVTTETGSIELRAVS